MTAPDKPLLLIVDDERNFVESLQLALEDEFSVTIALDLQSARREISKSAPAAVLLDLRLPDGDGMELFRELTGGISPVVVVMTAHSSVESFLAAMRLGAGEYLTKPFDIGQLKALLKRKVVAP